MMFKHVVVTAVALATLTAIGCGVEPDGPNAELGLDDIDEIVENLKLAGYPESEIEIDENDQVIAGGDAVVSLQASREMIGLDGDDAHDGDNQFRQYRTNNLVGASVEAICVNGSTFTGTMSTALDQAITRYNDRNVRFSFVRNSGGSTGCDAVINAVVVGGTGGSAGFPSGGLPYGQINIGSDIAPYYGVAALTHVIEHELGHCVGFRHTDYYNRSISCGSGGNEGDAGVGAVHIPNTPTDAVFDGSVMNSCYNTGSTGAFTNSDVQALHELYSCGDVGAWASGAAPNPWFDGANCFVASVPAGVSPFIYAGLWHTTAAPSCPMGSYDGANCYVQAAPANQFIYANGFYTTPTWVNGSPTCPAGSNYDGANCHWFNAPAGTTAYYSAGGWYTTSTPSCPLGAYDGANCYVGAPPTGSGAFIHEGGFYYSR